MSGQNLHGAMLLGQEDGVHWHRVLPWPPWLECGISLAPSLSLEQSPVTHHMGVSRLGVGDLVPRFSYDLEIVGRVQTKIGGGEVLSAIPDFPMPLPTQKAGHHSQNLMSPAPSMAHSWASSTALLRKGDRISGPHPS